MNDFIKLLLIFLVTMPVHATSCPEKSIKAAYEDAEYVFLGTVSEINTVTVEFTVERFWKAALDTNQIQLRLHQNPRDMSFQVGQEYVVYVRNRGYGNRTSYCDGTKLRNDAFLDLEYLNEHH